MLTKPLFNGAVRFSSANIMQQSVDSPPNRQNKSPSGSPTPPPPPPFPTATSVASPLYVTVANSADLGTHV